MKLFLVKIGRTTRKGGFQELAARSVSVNDEVTTRDLYDYFIPMYQGFNVSVIEPEYVELIDIPVVRKEVKREEVKKKDINKQKGSLSFRVRYNDFEGQLFKEYQEFRDKARYAIRDIEGSIKKRYGKLVFVNTTSCGNGNKEAVMDLTTDDYGTYCNSLSINSNGFFKVIKDCDNGTEELEITETPYVDEED